MRPATAQDDARSAAAGTAREDELEVARETRRRATSDPTQLHAYVWLCAHQLLLGVQPESRAELQRQADSLSADDVAVAAGQLLESALVLAAEPAEGAADLAADALALAIRTHRKASAPS
jgi:hypothetical protein